MCGNVGFDSGVPDSVVRREVGSVYATPHWWDERPRVLPWHKANRLIEGYPVLYSIPKRIKAYIGIVYEIISGPKQTPTITYTYIHIYI